MPKPTPQSDELANRVFLTSRGGEIVPVKSDGSRTDNLATPMRNLMKKCKCYRKGRSFYGLRHSLQNLGDGTKDFVAVKAIMGHAGNEMSDNYRHGIEDERLQAVTDHVREQLFPVISSESSIVSEADDAA